MKNKKFTIGLLSILILGVFTTGFVAFALAKPAIVLPEYEPMLLGEDFRLSEPEINVESLPENLGNSGKGKGKNGDSEEPVIMESKLWLSLDDYYGVYFFTMFDLWSVGDGTDAQVWVQQDLSWPENDSRSTPVVTPSQVAHLLAEFEGNIKPTDTEYFGDVDPHDGTFSLLEAWGYVPPGYYHDVAGRDVILVSNIEDENYYDETYPYYIAGFYSPSFEGYFDRNIISMDCYNWEDRIGPDADRPYLYEGLIAHEYQHLIHDDYFVVVPDATFMNEACSMFAEVLCGYPTDWSSINSFLATPDNSLTEWEDQGGINILADYGASFLWATFLNDYVDTDFLKDYVLSGRTDGPSVNPGIDLLNFNLVSYPTDRDTFEEVFNAWILANLIGSEYDTIDFNDKEAGTVRVYEVKDKLPDFAGTNFGNTITILDYDTGVSLLGPYGTDYIRLSKLKWQTPSELHFDGDEYATYPKWVMDGETWYSTPAGPLANMLHAAAVSLPDVPDLKLVFDTNYEIELDWDFGFVQVLDNVGDPLVDSDWNSLANSYTTNIHHPQAHPSIIAALPGLSGSSGGWIYGMEFDISLYRNEEVHVGFRYMTDWGTEEPGWWIDNVWVYSGATPLFEVTGFFTPVPETEFMVTVLRETFVDGEYYYDELAELNWIMGTNDGVLDLDPYLASIGEDIRYPDVVLLISNKVGVADYTVSVVPK